MNKIQITAKKDFLESLTAAKPMNALSELIWNGLDAQSDKISIRLMMSSLNGIESIRVRDFGEGIAHSQVQSFFGNLGESWKRRASKKRRRALHGKNGKGRFRAFALGGIVEWQTIYEDADANKYSYRIIGNVDALDDFTFTDPVKATIGAAGTEVIISNLHHEFGSLLADDAPDELGKTFAAYLSQYPEVEIDYNGRPVDPTVLQSNQSDYTIDDFDVGDGKKVSVGVSVIEWTVPTKRVIHLCDSKGIALHEVDAATIRAPGFEFTAYIKTDIFRDLDVENRLMLEDVDPQISLILKAAKGKIKGHFRKRLAEQQSQTVERWREQHIYPYETADAADAVEEAERQVFDILAVNVESYLPSFEDSDNKSKRFVFRLLAQAVRDNPDSVQRIIGEVLNLKKDEQDELADLLRHTPLTAIISSAKVVANRLDFLVGLDNLLFDKETKKKLLERDQLHKILEKEAWIFNEEFSLAGSEQRLEEVLSLHLGHLGLREEKQDDVILPNGKQGRVDLMLAKAVQPRDGEYDYLVVELKRPLKKIDSEVITQIERYAIAVAEDPRFNGQKCKWTFLVVSDEMDTYAKSRAKQRDWPRGKIYDNADLNITVWAREWAEVISDARTKLKFINSQLSYEANRGTSKAYLKKAHARFIPEITEETTEESDPVGE